MAPDLVGAVERILSRAGWESRTVAEGCFDLFAGGDDHSLILKVAENVDSTDREDIAEMKRVCRFLGAAPLVVSLRSSHRELQPGVVYERRGVPTVRPDTVDAYVRREERTVVMHTRGGRSVALDREELEERRKEEGYSVNALAKEVGVSRRTILNYRERGTASLEKAKRLHAVLGDVTRGIRLLERDVDASPRRTPVARRLHRLGLEASGVKRAPFDAAARDEEDRFVASRGAVDAARRRFLRAVTELADGTPFVVAEEEYDGLATIREDRLDAVRDKDELKDAVTR